MMHLGFRIYIGAMLLLLLAVIAHALSPLVNAPQFPAPLTPTAPLAAAELAATPAPSVTPTPAPTGEPGPPATREASPATPRPAGAAPPSAPPAPPLRKRFRAQPDDVVTQITPGIVHIYRATDDPLKINLLLFDITAPEFDLKTALGDGWLSGRMRTSYMVEQNGAIAGVNGDLFSADGIPQGLTMIDSKVAMAPKYRATFAWSKDRKPFIGYFTDQWTWQAEVVAPSGARTPMYQLNWFCPPDLICLFNRFARFVPARTGDVKVVLAPSGRVSSIVRELGVEIPAHHQVLQGTGEGARWLLNNLAVGDRVELNIVTDPPLSDYTQAISGGPIILQEGKFVQDCFCTLRDCSAVEESGLVCEDFDYEWKDSHYRWVRMPRTGIGFDKAQQTLIVAVVDGYQRGYSRGITQEEFADLFKEFGAYTAMELDGGGSSTMVLDGEIVNQPSDDTGERYVANALVFFWNDTPRAAPAYVPDQPLPRPALQPR